MKDMQPDGQAGKKKPVIICIDDDDAILNVLNVQLRKRFEGEYHCEFGESAEEGLEIIEECARDGRSVVMVVSDQIMPGMTGDKFLVNVHQNHPKPIKVLLTGQAAIETAINAINNANLFSYLTKPWDEEDLLLTIEKGLQQYHLYSELEETNEELVEVNDIFRRFVPDAIQERIAKEGIRKIDLGAAEESEATVMFSDLRAFCRIAEGLSPGETLKFLNGLMEPMISVIHDHGGFIQQFVGDGLMSIFYSQGDNAGDRAINAAIAMQARIAEINLSNRGGDKPEIRMGIGLNTGKIITGTIGNTTRMDAAVIGDTVNLASRMENLTKKYGSQILLTGNTLASQENPGQFQYRRIDVVRVAGKMEEVEIYEVIDSDAPELRAAKLETLRFFEQGLEHYFSKRWDEAKASFETCLKSAGDDPLPKMLIERCEGLLANPPGDDWDGIYTASKY